MNSLGTGLVLSIYGSALVFSVLLFLWLGKVVDEKRAKEATV